MKMIDSEPHLMMRCSMVVKKELRGGGAPRALSRSTLCASRKLAIRKKICTTSVELVSSITSPARRTWEHDN